MHTKQIIQASANVIRITNLRKGDVYKRIDDSSYGDKVHYGVVLNLYNNGEKTYIETIEYKARAGPGNLHRTLSGVSA